MFLLGLIPWWGRALALLAIVAAVWGHGALIGYGHEHGKTVAVQAAFELFKAETERLGKAQGERTEKTIAQQKGITDAVIKEYADRLARLPRFGVQQPVPNPSGGTVPEISCPAPSADGRPADAVPAVAAADFNQLANLAAQTTLMLVDLQKWVREQQAAFQ